MSRLRIVRHQETIVQEPAPAPVVFPWYCIWCFCGKDIAKAKCPGCSHYGSTSLPQSSFRCIFVEEY